MSERNTNRPLESVRKWDPTAYSTSLANGEIIAAPCAEYSRIAGPKGTSRPRLALSTFDFRLLLMMGLRGENEQRNCAGGAWIVTTREACTLAQGSPRGAWNRPSRFPSFRFLVSSFWFSGFLAFCVPLSAALISSPSVSSPAPLHGASSPHSSNVDQTVSTWKQNSISRSPLRAANFGSRRFLIGRGPSSESAGGSHRDLGWSAQCRRR